MKYSAKMSLAVVAALTMAAAPALSAPENKYVDQINAMPLSDQVAVMSMAIGTAGLSCDATGVLYRGIDPDTGSGFYGVLCQSGTHYMVSFPNDPSVHSKVVECAALAPLDIHCF